MAIRENMIVIDDIPEKDEESIKKNIEKDKALNFFKSQHKKLCNKQRRLSQENVFLKRQISIGNSIHDDFDYDIENQDNEIKQDDEINQDYVLKTDPHLKNNQHNEVTEHDGIEISIIDSSNEDEINKVNDMRI